MEWAIELYDKVAKVGFAGMLFLALVGHYFDVWRWGRTEREREKKDAAACAKLEEKAALDIAKLDADFRAWQAVAAGREAAQQHRIDQLMDRMIEAAGILEKSARSVSR